jgi:hypothetical protein
MNRISPPFRWLAVVLALPVLGCAALASTSIHYRATAPEPSSGPTVSLSILDERKEDEGGTQKDVVGKIRSPLGNGQSMHQTKGQNVSNLVRSATADGLARARVVVAEGASRKLTTRVQRFWMDVFHVGHRGSGDYKASIDVELILSDSDGKVIWKDFVSGDAEGAQGGGSAASFFDRVFEDALDRYAQAIGARLQKEDFQTAVR